ncbi:MAG: hypothetical protein HY689_04765 [Chloroflexi bacterium]|nr:hypothetical protein [Chloroflexota bacterium]
MPLIHIQGVIEVDEETGHEDFMEAFLAWLEEHGWEFEGQTSLTKEEED